MADFVNYENTKSRANNAYSELVKKIATDGVCPFCPEHFAKYHTNPIIVEGAHWFFTKNLHPYEGAKYHILIVHKEHVETIADIAPPAWEELRIMVARYIAEEKIPGGSFLMRFGDPVFTRASVRHLHAHLISKKEGASVVTHVG